MFVLPDDKGNIESRSVIGNAIEHRRLMSLCVFLSRIKPIDCVNESKNENLMQNEPSSDRNDHI